MMEGPRGDEARSHAQPGKPSGDCGLCRDMVRFCCRFLCSPSLLLFPLLSNPRRRPRPPFLTYIHTVLYTHARTPTYGTEYSAHPTYAHACASSVPELGTGRQARGIVGRFSAKEGGGGGTDGRPDSPVICPGQAKASSIYGAGWRSSVRLAVRPPSASRPEGGNTLRRSSCLTAPAASHALGAAKGRSNLGIGGGMLTWRRIWKPTKGYSHWH